MEFQLTISKYFKKKKQELKKEFAKIRKIKILANYKQDDDRCLFCYCPYKQEHDSCQFCDYYCPSDDEKEIKNKSINTWSVINIDNFVNDNKKDEDYDEWSTRKKKHDNDKNCQNDSVAKKIKVGDGNDKEDYSVKFEGNFDNNDDNGKNSESDSDDGWNSIIKKIEERRARKIITEKPV